MPTSYCSPLSVLMNDQVHKYCHYLPSAYKYGVQQNEKLFLIEFKMAATGYSMEYFYCAYFEGHDFLYMPQVQLVNICRRNLINNNIIINALQNRHTGRVQIIG